MGMLKPRFNSGKVLVFSLPAPDSGGPEVSPSGFLLDSLAPAAWQRTAPNPAWRVPLSLSVLLGYRSECTSQSESWCFWPGEKLVLVPRSTWEHWTENSIYIDAETLPKECLCYSWLNSLPPVEHINAEGCVFLLLSYFRTKTTNSWKRRGTSFSRSCHNSFPEEVYSYGTVFFRSRKRL